MARKEVIADNKEALDQVIQCIEDSTAFILEAGAGSGKTRTLVESLKYISNKYSKTLTSSDKKVVCITYTNVAKDEITERIERNPLVLVLTIHEFLWSVIKKYQEEVKLIIAEFERKKEDHDNEILNRFPYIQIDYTLYAKDLEKGRISHNDVIEISLELFMKYPKLSKIIADKYPYIFIDEYQDTDPKTVTLLINNLLLKSKNLVIGFFGDSMQKIYDNGVGKIENLSLKKITKIENFRCSLKVIDLLNKIRIDLIQHPSGQNLSGEVLFFHSNDIQDATKNYERTITYLQGQKHWNISRTKILMLTHKVIADRLGYENLLEAYNKISFGRERLINKEDRYSDLLNNKIEELVFLYEEKRYAEFVRMLGIEGFKVVSHIDKRNLSDLMTQLNQKRENGTVKDVIEFAFANKLVSKPSRIEEFEKKISAPETTENKKSIAFYNALMKVAYKEVVQLHRFIQESTPFSTKHGVKGAEFDNVIVVVEDGAWTKFNFNELFSGKNQSKDRYNRTLNLFYVCCSRAKDKLAILNLTKLDTKAMHNIGDWFGKENIIDIQRI